MQEIHPYYRMGLKIELILGHAKHWSKDIAAQYCRMWLSHIAKLKHRLQQCLHPSNMRTGRSF